MLFISLLILDYYFYCSRFYSIYLVYHFAVMRFVVFLFFFFFKHFYIRIKYIRIQEQTATTWLACVDMLFLQADLGLRCSHMQKEPFSHDMALS